MKRIFFMTAVVFLCLAINAQTTLKGVVEDSVTHQKLPNASVVILRNGKTVKFTRTDEKGNFKFSAISLQPKDMLQASCIGYRKTRITVGKNEENVIIAMPPEAFTLKEVEVKGSRVFGRQDTTTYDLTRFADSRDNSLKDVLKKLPGVSVSEGGQIEYNGKPLDRFTVEGLDMTGGRYGQLTDALKAKDVKKAEIIEHDQPVKALRNKVFTDNTAMNIELKDEARDKWMITLRPYLFAGKPTHAGGSADAMQIGKNRQIMYEAAYDRTGKDISASSDILAQYMNRSNAADLPRWFASPAMVAPIDADRLRFNTSQKYSVNSVRKIKEEGERRISASYNRSVIRQQTSNSSVYYFDGMQPVMTDETRHLLLKNDDFTAEFEAKTNTENVYGNLMFKLEASQADGFFTLNNTGKNELNQRVRIPQFDISGNLTRMITLGKATLSVNSTVDYHYSPSCLYVNDDKYKLKSNLWHTSNKFSWLRKRTFFTQRYTAGIVAENLNVIGNNAHFSFSASPYWEYKRGIITVSLSPNMSYERFTRQNASFFLINPTFILNLETNNRQAWRMFVMYDKNVGEMGDFVLSGYKKDYRTVIMTGDIIPQSKRFAANINYEYKRATKEFFWNANASYSRHWRNTMTDMVIDNGNYVMRRLERNNNNDFFNVRGTVSKGFFDIHLLTKMSASFNYYNGEQLSAGKLSAYSMRSFEVSPSVTYNPKWCVVNYNAAFDVSKSHASSAEFATLFNWRQSLSLTATISNIDLSMSFTHYRNELDADNVLNTLLSDVNAVWRNDKIRVSAELRNLFNKKNYIIHSYGGISRITDTYQLRPREFMLNFQYSL